MVSGTPLGPVCRRSKNALSLEQGGTEQPLSGASESPDGPSVSPLSPAGRRPAGAHRSPAQSRALSLADRRLRQLSPVEDQMLISHRSCHPRLLRSASALRLQGEAIPPPHPGTKAGPPGSRRDFGVGATVNQRSSQSLASLLSQRGFR